MSNYPVSVVRDISRDEYAALAKPLRGQGKRIVSRAIICVVSVAVLPLLLSAVIFYSTTTIVSIQTLGRVPIRGPVAPPSLRRVLPIFLPYQALYLIVATTQAVAMLCGGCARLRRLFPDSRRRQTITTQITPYGVVQFCAGASVVTPWGCVIRIDEIPEAFILHTQNIPIPRSWMSIADLVYILKSGPSLVDATITATVLDKFRADSELLPNHLWHADSKLLTPVSEPDANAIWPPPPSGTQAKVEEDIPITGTISLPMFEVTADGSKLTFKQSLASKLKKVPISLAMPVALVLSYRQFLPGSVLYWACAVALVLSGIACIIMWRSSPFLSIDRKMSLIKFGRRRFATISEIDSITVKDLSTIGAFGSGRGFAFVSIRKTNGKQRQLPTGQYAGTLETNIVAMIISRYISESLDQTTPSAEETKLASSIPPISL